MLSLPVYVANLVLSLRTFVYTTRSLCHNASSKFMDVPWSAECC
jgi:hypothetical protein